MLSLRSRNWIDAARSFSPLRAAILRLRRIRTAIIDRWLNIRTPYPNKLKFDLGTHFGDAVPNEPVDYALLRKFMKPVRLETTDVVFDIGCGMGRALCMFARRPVARCVGVEFDRQLALAARENARRLRGRRAPVTVWRGDAVDADYASGTVFWLFNPFGSQTLRAFLARLKLSLQQSPRPIQIIYVNPVCEADLASCDWLECAGRTSSVFFGTYGATYWTNSQYRSKPPVAIESNVRMESFILLKRERPALVTRARLPN